jgi:hypothetical protein
MTWVEVRKERLSLGELLEMQRRDDKHERKGDLRNGVGCPVNENRDEKIENGSKGMGNETSEWKWAKGTTYGGWA